jgi:uncharacterized protein (TIGR00255 family)
VAGPGGKFRRSLIPPAMTKTASTLTSMTGFSRTSGQWRDLAWVWEMKSVNGKALDLRFRLPPGYDSLETHARTLASAHLKRGNIQVNLQVQSAAGENPLKVNAALLDQLVQLAESLRSRLGSPAVQAENLLGLRGVLEADELVLNEDGLKSRDAALLASCEACFAELASARKAEGERLASVLGQQLNRITELTEAARNNPARSIEAIRARLSEQVAKLMQAGETLDPQRLHQEAVLLATRADIQEELDRLGSHIAAARVLMAAKEPVGRKFDFLAQEFNREANTLCSKSNDPSLTAIGLDLKTVIDQLREQIQNIE